MLTASARRRVAVLREPASAARIARILWIAWAVIVWNVVLDHVIVAAGRDYIRAAVHAAGQSRGLTPATLNMDDWMHPAATHGLVIASVAAAAIAVAGLVLVRMAARADTPHG
jgi:ABC-type Fe3+ transport system permease subunit